MAETLKKTRKVYALGETVLDLISSGGLSFRGVPGGSVLNASVSLGRMNTEVQLISEWGDDKIADQIEYFLHDNGVKTDFCIRNIEYKTSLALAFLDNSRNASYSFYHHSPELISILHFPDFTKDDILLFGSFYAVKPERREFVEGLLNKAVAAGSIIYYDLNIRKAHAAALETCLPSYIKNISAATIVKGSDEDFRNLFGITDPVEIYKKLGGYCKILLITAGDKPLQIFMPELNKSYNVPDIKPVSTIGAGDNFNAGFIYGIATSGIDSKQLENISVEELDRIIGCGLAFATETCLSDDNYVVGNFEPDFWKKYI
jgi:fructokinase